MQSLECGSISGFIESPILREDGGGNPGCRWIAAGVVDPVGRAGSGALCLAGV